MIASGKTEVVVEHRRMKSYIPGVEWCYLDDATYARSINDLQMKYPFVKFVPESPEAYQRGVEKLSTLATENLDRLDKEVGRHKKALTDLGKPIPGEMLHDAIDGYIEWIKVEYFDRAEGHVSDSGMTKIRQVKTIRSHLENVPLASLDYSGVDRIFAYFRKRPLSKRSENPMTGKSCRHYIGELDRAVKVAQTTVYRHLKEFPQAHQDEADGQSGN